MEEGSKIFVSIAKACDFFPLLLIQELKLVPFVYKGLEDLEGLPPGQTTSVHIEAKADLQNCQVFVLVLPLSPRGKIGGRAWSLAEFDLLTRAGMKGFLYLPLVENIPESKDSSMDFFLPPYATIRNASDCESLNEILKHDLLCLMKAKPVI